MDFRCRFFGNPICETLQYSSNLLTWDQEFICCNPNHNEACTS